MHHWHALLAFVLPFPFLALRAERYYRSLPQLPMTNDPLSNNHYPSLSIIIPARNEAENLRLLLPSLSAIQYDGFVEILVVDDNSTDETARVAKHFEARVLCAGELPPGWLGKPNACHRGAQAARGDWLLFTDADTVHNPNGPARAVQYALTHKLDGLSLLLSEHTFGFLDKIALMAAFTGLFAGMQKGHPVMNGQYILLRREVYEKSGGFERVHNEPLEDLALAHSLSKQGFCIPIVRGETAAEVRMYRDVSHLWHGLTRLGSGSLKWSGVGSLLTALFITGAMTPVLALPVLLLDTTPISWVIGTWVVVILFFIPWAIRSGSWKWAILAPFGALTVQVAAMWGLVSGMLGRGVLWKGRRV